MIEPIPHSTPMSEAASDPIASELVRCVGAP